MRVGVSVRHSHYYSYHSNLIRLHIELTSREGDYYFKGGPLFQGGNDKLIRISRVQILTRAPPDSPKATLFLRTPESLQSKMISVPHTSIL